MLDKKINFNFCGNLCDKGSLEQTPNNISSLAKQKPDEFIKSTGTRKEMHSPEDIVEIFSDYDYENIANQLMNRNKCFLIDGAIDFRIAKQPNSYAIVQINDNFNDSVKTYKYSKVEIKSLLEKLYIKNVTNNSEKAEEYANLNSQLMEKIDSEFN